MGIILGILGFIVMWACISQPSGNNHFSNSCRDESDELTEKEKRLCVSSAASIDSLKYGKKYARKQLNSGAYITSESLIQGKATNNSWQAPTDPTFMPYNQADCETIENMVKSGRLIGEVYRREYYRATGKLVEHVVGAPRGRYEWSEIQYKKEKKVFFYPGVEDSLGH